MIISATLLMLTYFLYNLTDEIRQFDVNNITNGIDSVNNNLDGFNKFGYKFTQQIEQFDSSALQNFDITNFNKLINKMNQTLFNFDINKLNTLIDRFINSRISEFDIDDLNQLVIQMNQTIFNLNNAIQNVRPVEITQQYIESATDITPSIPTSSPTTPDPESPPTPPTPSTSSTGRRSSISAALLKRRSSIDTTPSLDFAMTDWKVKTVTEINIPGLKVLEPVKVSPPCLGLETRWKTAHMRTTSS